MRGHGRLGARADTRRTFSTDGTACDDAARPSRSRAASGRRSWCRLQRLVDGVAAPGGGRGRGSSGPTSRRSRCSVLPSASVIVAPAARRMKSGIAADGLPRAHRAVDAARNALPAPRTVCGLGALHESSLTGCALATNEVSDDPGADRSAASHPHPPRGQSAVEILLAPLRERVRPSPPSPPAPGIFPVYCRSRFPTPEQPVDCAVERQPGRWCEPLIYLGLSLIPIC